MNILIETGPIVEYWQKDGRWHVTEKYTPTDSDRAQFPASYPKDDDGPFYVWSSESFDTEQEARAFIQERTK